MSEKSNLNALINESEQQMMLDTGYSEKAISYYTEKPYIGILPDAEHVSEMKGTCGDTMKISLRIEDGNIIDVYFWTDGCGATVACGSMLTKIIKGKKIEGAANITCENLTNALKGLPKEHVHCSILTVNTFQKAIKNYNNKIKS